MRGERGEVRDFQCSPMGRQQSAGSERFISPFLVSFPTPTPTPFLGFFPWRLIGAPLIISEGKPEETPKFLPHFPWALTITSVKHTVTLIADFEAPLVDIQITFERDFHCGSINFQANFARTLRPTNDNLFCGITALLHFDFYKVKFLTSLRILKLGKKESKKYF